MVEGDEVINSWQYQQLQQQELQLQNSQILGMLGTQHTPCHVSWWELLSVWQGKLREGKANPDKTQSL